MERVASRAAHVGSFLAFRALVGSHDRQPLSLRTERYSSFWDRCDIVELLTIAAEGGHFEIVQFALRFEQARSYARNWVGYNFLLERAIVCSDIVFVDFLLSDEDLKPEEKTLSERHCLHIAAASADVKMFRLLLEHKDNHVDPQGHNYYGDTPLHFAARHNNLEIVKFLTSLHTTDLNMLNQHGLHPMHLTAMQDSQGDAMETIKYFRTLDQIDINVRDAHGNTLLYHVIRSGKIELLEFLLSVENINPNLPCDADNHTPLHTAVQWSQKGAVRVLLECGDKLLLNARDSRQLTPVHHAVVQHDVLALFIDCERLCDIDVLARDKHGNTPLHRAADVGTSSSVELLLQRPAIRSSINARNSNDETALHLAVRRRTRDAIQIVKLLLTLDNIRVWLRDNNGQTALQRSREYGLNENVAALRWFTARKIRKRILRCVHYPVSSLGQ